MKVTSAPENEKKKGNKNRHQSKRMCLAKRFEHIKNPGSWVTNQPSIAMPSARGGAVLGGGGHAGHHVVLSLIIGSWEEGHGTS
ncbi:hypothetical protein CEXT_345531 [Caerostris extrusa]|uniref:Uncharacterized protein n=1 Tax=Caerostris extrusa TaxID=172846 RepID=A0AAV4R5F8_CAEEX|nr:hypothetical protein CEXT_345531 [Caerostris extrusa]